MLGWLATSDSSSRRRLVYFFRDRHRYNRPLPSLDGFDDNLSLCSLSGCGLFNAYTWAPIRDWTSARTCSISANASASSERIARSSSLKEFISRFQMSSASRRCCWSSPRNHCSAPLSGNSRVRSPTNSPLSSGILCRVHICLLLNLSW